MTARLAAPVTVASGRPSFARSSVAPMLQEKELPDSRHPVVAVPPRRKRARADRKPVQLWAHSDHRDRGSSLDACLPKSRGQGGTRSRVSLLLVKRGIKVTASRVLTTVRASRNRAGRWLRAAAMTARSVPWLVTWENEADVTYRSSLLTKRVRGAQVHPNMSAPAQRPAVNRCSGGGYFRLVLPVGPTLFSASGEPSRMFQSFR